MTIEFFLFGGLILAWAFGRNNFSNVFGTAVGTGIVSFKFAAFLTGLFLLLGAFFNSSGTSVTMSELAHFDTLSGAFSFSIIVTMMMMLLTRLSIPASVAQVSIGALIGWNLALSNDIVWDQVIDIFLGWFYSPLIACSFSFILFKIMRLFLQKYPVPLLRRDMWVRVLWVFVGSFTAYSLGANNLPVLMTPFSQMVGQVPELSLLFSMAAGLGCLMASKKVIRMLSFKLFPLSSVESLIAGFSSALTLLLFSFHNGLFPALPISISASLVGSIVGISFAKGGYGLRGEALLSIVLSWIWAPLFSGLLSYAFILIMNFWGM